MYVKSDLVEQQKKSPTKANLKFSRLDSPVRLFFKLFILFQKSFFHLKNRRKPTICRIPEKIQSHTWHER
jgi:hypothetical protein